MTSLTCFRLLSLTGAVSIQGLDRRPINPCCGRQGFCVGGNAGVVQRCSSAAVPQAQLNPEL